MHSTPSLSYASTRRKTVFLHFAWLGLSFMWSNQEHKRQNHKSKSFTSSKWLAWQMANFATTSLQVRNWCFESCYRFQICYHTWQFPIYKDSLVLLENNLQPIISNKMNFSRRATNSPLTLADITPGKEIQNNNFQNLSIISEIWHPKH